jgi:phosphoserine phosphatase RsbU/P
MFRTNCLSPGIAAMVADSELERLPRAALIELLKETQAQLVRLQQINSDLEITLETTVAHATQIENELQKSAEQLLRLHSQEQKYIEALRHELETGRQIQTDFLPEHLPQLSGWGLAAYFEPAQDVAGDFYDAFLLPGNRLVLVIADVCDKGVGAALFMALTRSLLRSLAQQAFNRLQHIGAQAENYFVRVPNNSDMLLLPAYTFEILNSVGLTNEYITANHSRVEMFATVFFGVIDLTSGKLSYINAGHEATLLVNRAGIKAQLPSTGPAIGILPDASYEMNQTLLVPGDFLLAYTDGVTEAFDAAGKFFSEARLQNLAVAYCQFPDASAAGLLATVQQAVQDYAGHDRQRDDITMLGLHYDYEAKGANRSSERENGSDKKHVINE